MSKPEHIGSILPRVMQDIAQRCGFENQKRDPDPKPDDDERTKKPRGIRPGEFDETQHRLVEKW